jgi:hypothetical protein
MPNAAVDHFFPDPPSQVAASSRRACYHRVHV